MLSRMKNIRETIGSVLIFIGIVWLMGVVGTDDYNTAQQIATPMIWLIVKTVAGFAIIGAGARMSKGGK